MAMPSVAVFKQAYPGVYFVKTKIHIENFDYETIRENFIPDDDSPEFPSQESIVRIYPLAVSDFPCVLQSNTAFRAGIWAIAKCKQEKWATDLPNMCSCLAQLEMDF